MSPEPDPRLDIDVDGDVYVSPRHLASTNGIGDLALAPLLALGWDLQHDVLGNAYVTAPDLRVRLGYLPEGEDDGLWRINAYQDPFGPSAWGACFNDRTPTEFVHAFTTALAAAYEQGPDAYLARPDADSSEHDPFLAVVPLLQQGWEIERPRWGVLAIHAPDGRAGLEFTTGDLDPAAKLTTRSARWQLWAGKSIDRPAWYATASTDTPIALLTAVTQCVADLGPLPADRPQPAPADSTGPNCTGSATCFCKHRSSTPNCACPSPGAPSSATPTTPPPFRAHRSPCGSASL